MVCYWKCNFYTLACCGEYPETWARTDKYIWFISWDKENMNCKCCYSLNDISCLVRNSCRDYVRHVNIEIHTCIVGAVIGCFKDSFPSDTVSTRGVQHDAEELFPIHSSCFHRSLTSLSDYNWSFYLISILDHECKSAGNEPGLHCSFCKNDTIVYGSVALLNNYFYSLSQFIHSAPVYSYLRGEVGCIKYGSWIFGKYVSIMLVWPLLQTLDISSLFNILRCRPRALNINDNFLAKYSIEWWLT